MCQCRSRSRTGYPRLSQAVSPCYAECVIVTRNIDDAAKVEGCPRPPPQLLRNLAWRGTRPKSAIDGMQCLSIEGMQCVPYGPGRANPFARFGVHSAHDRIGKSRRIRVATTKGMKEFVHQSFQEIRARSARVIDPDVGRYCRENPGTGRFLSANTFRPPPRQSDPSVRLLVRMRPFFQRRELDKNFTVSWTEQVARPGFVTNPQPPIVGQRRVDQLYCAHCLTDQVRRRAFGHANDRRVRAETPRVAVRVMFVGE